MVNLCAVLVASWGLSSAAFALRPRHGNPSCRYLPTDDGWPTTADWDRLNTTVSGKLVRGEPLAQPCYRPSEDVAKCAQVRGAWGSNSIYYDDPVAVMSPFWLNNSCNPFLSSASDTCTLDNVASYAISVTDAASVMAGLEFAQQKNIRVSVKNTGHDYLGRSTGKGSLALWTHDLRDVSIITNYTGSTYAGPAVKMGAGVLGHEVANIAATYGLRVAVGLCPSVGVAGGFSQNGGYGQLSSLYGLAADNTLEFEVVTTDQRHLIASPSTNADLYWALSGGGSGNYGIVLSQTVKAHPDGQIAGATFVFTSANSTAFWLAVQAWYQLSPRFGLVPGFSASWIFTSGLFRLTAATLPGGSVSNLDAILQDFYQAAQELNVALIAKSTIERQSFVELYDTLVPPDRQDSSFPSNNTIGSRLVPAAVVRDNLTALLEVYQRILNDDTVPGEIVVGGTSNNVSNANVGVEADSNAVLPAWRNALLSSSAAVSFPDDASVENLQLIQAKVNTWQDWVKDLTPGSGSYINEATYDNPQWKLDYYGKNYERLLQVKEKYDGNFTLWQHTSVGTDVYWQEDAEGRLCRVE
ncbi:FAD binding domain-containing protein [Colletotrichum graminicola]|uniref:FAD binding domain-containing protein n=1 Tax=Colletotrichum graminicola (strain M1.001 / M2 / FGSC 10212) TaxID=645133 RepID=E3QX13_COLGM|nr:FAD binding domain-containing protein [Colletotrichum graminicola M1.001]EFQ35401.1 FAD binding domain-containing protein [Colletotrichum graminicola M1.001]WDK14951.1 FAD binding domain-containing protein [Colletotrichum graminicola]